MNEWFYCNGQNPVQGPISGPEMKAAASAGHITAATLVRKGQSGRWVNANQVKGLLDAVPPKEPPANGPDRQTLVEASQPSKLVFAVATVACVAALSMVICLSLYFAFANRSKVENQELAKLRQQNEQLSEKLDAIAENEEREQERIAQEKEKERLAEAEKEQQRLKYFAVRSKIADYEQEIFRITGETEALLAFAKSINNSGGNELTGEIVTEINEQLLPIYRKNLSRLLDEAKTLRNQIAEDVKKPEESESDLSSSLPLLLKWAETALAATEKAKNTFEKDDPLTFDAFEAVNDCRLALADAGRLRDALSTSLSGLSANGFETAWKEKHAADYAKHQSDSHSAIDRMTHSLRSEYGVIGKKVTELVFEQKEKAAKEAMQADFKTRAERILTALTEVEKEHVKPLVEAKKTFREALVTYQQNIGLESIPVRTRNAARTVASARGARVDAEITLRKHDKLLAANATDLGNKYDAVIEAVSIVSRASQNSELITWCDTLTKYLELKKQFWMLYVALPSDENQAAVDQYVSFLRLENGDEVYKAMVEKWKSSRAEMESLREKLTRPDSSVYFKDEFPRSLDP